MVNARIGIMNAGIGAVNTEAWQATEH